MTSAVVVASSLPSRTASRIRRLGSASFVSAPTAYARTVVSRTITRDPNGAPRAPDGALGARAVRSAAPERSSERPWSDAPTRPDRRGRSPHGRAPLPASSSDASPLRGANSDVHQDVVDAVI